MKEEDISIFLSRFPFGQLRTVMGNFIMDISSGKLRRSLAEYDGGYKPFSQPWHANYEVKSGWLYEKIVWLSEKFGLPKPVRLIEYGKYGNRINGEAYAQSASILITRPCGEEYAKSETLRPHIAGHEFAHFFQGELDGGLLSPDWDKARNPTKMAQNHIREYHADVFSVATLGEENEKEIITWQSEVYSPPTQRHPSSTYRTLFVKRLSRCQEFRDVRHDPNPETNTALQRLVKKVAEKEGWVGR